MKPTNQTLITNCRLVEEQRVMENAALLIEGDIIQAVHSSGESAGALRDIPSERVVDAEGGWLLPGFIDVHVHGGAGRDFMDATKEALDGITRFHGLHGTTAMHATSVTAPRERLTALLEAAWQYTRADMPYAQLLGVHLEGPFISPKWPGAQNPKYIVPPRKEWVEDWAAAYPGLIRMVTLAPEAEGALELIEWLKDHGIIAAAGHTDASYDEIERAVEQGLNHAVHTFNAMTGLHHRKPGTAGAVLTDERICAEVIADGHHVHPACIRLLAKVKTAANLLLITDAMSAAGLGNGTYDLGGLQVAVKDGVARLKEGDSLAGSTLTMIDAFRFVVRKVGLSVPEASLLASRNPAVALGIADRTGTIRAGKQADLLLVDASLELRKVWVRGRLLSGE